MLPCRSTPMGDREIIWRPTPERIERARITQLMRRHGLASLDALLRKSVDDPEWYWDAVSKDLGFRWMKPYTRVLDNSRGIAWPRWFEGGLMNLSDNCVDRHVDEGRGEQPAIVWEAESGEVRTWTYRELSREVNRLANVLTRLGVGAGDSVGLFLPMCAEAAIALMAICRIGAIYSPSFSGYGAQAVAARLQDCDAKVLICADGFPRRGQTVRMKEVADEAAALSPSVKHLLVLQRLGRGAVDAGARRVVARGRRARVRRVPRAAGGRRQALLPHLHVGDDRQAQGRGADPRWAPDEDRPRRGLSLRPGHSRSLL